MTTVIRHFPKPYLQNARMNIAPLVTDLGLRAWEAICRGDVAPTVRAVASRYERCRDAVSRALRSLEKGGLLYRWRRSAGKNRFVWFAVVTDEPFAWRLDDRLIARIAEIEAEEVARAKAALRDDEAYGPEVPPVEAEAVESQVGSCPASQDITNKEPLNKDLFLQPVDKPRRDTYTERLTKLLGANRSLEPHLPNALALLHGLGFPPLSRANYGIVVAEALHSGRSMDGMIRYLTRSLDGARSSRAVQKSRLDKLRATLRRERSRRHAPGTLVA